MRKAQKNSSQKTAAEIGLKPQPRCDIVIVKGLGTCSLHFSYSNKDPFLPFLALPNGCLQAAPFQASIPASNILENTENSFLQEEVSLLLQTKINPPHRWYTMLTMYFISQSQCLEGIGKEGIKKSNTFVRNIWNNATDKLIKRNVYRILLGFLKWRGPRVLQYRAEKCITASQLTRHSNRFQLSKEEQHENSHPGLTTDPPKSASHLWQLLRLSTMAILCCSCSPKMLIYGTQAKLQ